MRKLMFYFAFVLILLSFAYAQQVDPFLLPERANSRINASVEIAKELKSMGYKRMAVVYMETSDLCALFSASLVASLKTLGVEAYYIKGGEGLEERLKALQPFHVYMAYFGERPPQEVQTHFTEDLRRVLRYEKRPSLVIQPALLAMGFVNGLLTDEEISSTLQEVPMLSFLFESGKAKPVKVVIKDLEVKVTPAQEGAKPAKPKREQRRK